MKISDSEMDSLGYAAEELQELADLIEQIIHENSDGATGEEMRELGILWELVFAASKELEALHQKQIGPGADLNIQNAGRSHGQPAKSEQGLESNDSKLSVRVQTKKGGDRKIKASRDVLKTCKRAKNSSLIV